MMLKKSSDVVALSAAWIDTPLGPMMALGDEEALYLLEFMNPQRLEREVEKLRKASKSVILAGRTKILDSIEEELRRYFEGRLETFHTPIKMLGTAFQKRVWLELMKIPLGETRSYFDIAKGLDSPGAVRAVGSANGANQIAIVIPCHRVINADGKLGGYGGGLYRKKRLLEHEYKYGKR
jgi:AraC family transcriptional regulator, regulatory protein of adaptative response / methylated-DNA-[protein]-cysteine methyltransferase